MSKTEITQEVTGLRAPEFPEPEPLDLSDEELERISEVIAQLYQDEVQQRTRWNTDHVLYDEMYRGQINEEREGPWENSANLHVQMPYWLVDSISARQAMAIWEQQPLVGGWATEDDDQKPLADAQRLIRMHMDPKRMNAFERWCVISRTRNIHGLGVGYLPYVKEDYVYRRLKAQGEVTFALNPDGTYQLDEETNEPIRVQEATFALARDEKYHGPIIVPVGWEDVLSPISGGNLQPQGPSNPHGSSFVFLRQWEPLSLMWKKRQGSYTYLLDDAEMQKREFWLEAARSQDRSSSLTGDNNRQARNQDLQEGRNRSLKGRRKPQGKADPEFENLFCFMPWTIPNEEGEEEDLECLFFFNCETKKVMGAFLLADINFRNRRPLLELHFQKVEDRINSMGVMEICKHLSAELDTLHNLRLDVGFATNMPYFFMKASSVINPENIVLKPLSPIPVEDPKDITFPPTVNVTTFYYQEEQMLFTIVERVMGVTDLFLGVSPTRGAASRHATGFVGTQQEALARMTEIIHRDAIAFSFMCHLIYEGEMQFGPDWRRFRVAGKESASTVKLNKHQLWLRGEYDFTVGANAGMYSQMIQQQRAQALVMHAQTNPLIMQDMGRWWEVSRDYIHSIGYPDPERFIGQREALPQASPLTQDEENGQMAQFAFGNGVPAPVNPNDNDQEHLQKLMEFVRSEEYAGMKSPNFPAFMAHTQLHMRQMEQKQQMQQAQAMAAAGGGEGGPEAGGASPTALNVAQLSGMGAAGQMGAVPERGGGGNGFNPPTIGEPT
jgi:hypothetical protein